MERDERGDGENTLDENPRIRWKEVYLERNGTDGGFNGSHDDDGIIEER